MIMAMQFKYTGPVNENLLCPICQQPLLCPRTLKRCRHTFCWPCLEAAASHGHLTACPTCRVPLMAGAGPTHPHAVADSSCLDSLPLARDPQRALVSALWRLMDTNDSDVGSDRGSTCSPSASSSSTNSSSSSSSSSSSTYSSPSSPSSSSSSSSLSHGSLRRGVVSSFVARVSLPADWIVRTMVQELEVECLRCCLLSHRLEESGGRPFRCQRSLLLAHWKNDCIPWDLDSVESELLTAVPSVAVGDLYAAAQPHSFVTVERVQAIEDRLTALEGQRCVHGCSVSASRRPSGHSAMDLVSWFDRFQADFCRLLYSMESRHTVLMVSEWSRLSRDLNAILSRLSRMEESLLDPSHQSATDLGTSGNRTDSACSSSQFPGSHRTCGLVSSPSSVDPPLDSVVMHSPESGTVSKTRVKL